MASLRQIRLTVNGVPYEAQVEPRTTLVDLLRGELGLTGTHVGCEHGVCGACTVLLNGLPVRSCIMLAVQADGASFMTVEGMAQDGKLHPIQEAFQEEHGLQCGFCTPGFLLTTYELLQRNRNPSDAEIKDALGGQLCRCTGYQAIVKSVRLAAAKLREAKGDGGQSEGALAETVGWEGTRGARRVVAGGTAGGGDGPRPSLPRERVLALSAEHDEGCFVLPGVVSPSEDE